MDVVRVRTCKGSNCIEIQLDWQYEGKKHCSIVAMPLEHFRKEDMWSIVRMLLDAAENQSKKKEEKSEWISVKDRLPEKNGVVLVCTEDDYVCSAGYSNYGKPTFLIDSMYGGDELDDVTHWMPLPPAPKEDA